MRKYIKPTMAYEMFVANESISTCSVTNTYNSVKVDCVITNHHHIFYDGCETVTNCVESSCDGGINYEDATIVSYNGAEYLVWSGNTGGRAGVNNNMQLLNAIITAGVEQGLFPEGTTGQGKHAGLITPDIESVVNASL